MTQTTLEDTGSNPRAGGKKEQQKISQVLQLTSPPICKTGTWSCTGGAKHTDWDYRVPTPAVGGMVGTSCEFLARAPGVLIAPAHRTCLVHRCRGLSRNA